MSSFNFNSQSQPQQPQTPPPPAFNMQDLIALFQQGQAQTAQIQGQNQAQAQQGRLQAQREVLTPQHLGMSGGVINPTTGVEAGNPFENGFFKSGVQRAQVESDRLTVDPAHPMHGAALSRPEEHVGTDILRPGAAFNFIPPDNTFDQQITMPNFSAKDPNFAEGAIGRTDSAMSTLKRQRQQRNPFAF